MMKNNKSPFFISVIVPIEKFGLEKRQTIENIQQNLDKYYWDYELILVSSKEQFDGNHFELDCLLNKVPSIRYIQLQAKLSKDVLFECGTESSIGDFVVLFDLNKDPIELIKAAVEEGARGKDILIGVTSFNNSLFYRTGREFARFFLNLSEYNLPRDASSFRVLSRRAVNAIFSSGKPSQDFFMRIQNCGLSWGIIRYHSVSKINKNFKEGFRKTLDLMVFNSLKPLRLVSVLGFVGSFCAFLFALYSLLIQIFKTSVVEGWTSIVLLISFFFLLQFFILAFISEYLARLLKDWNRESDYAVVFERNSRVMVNRNRINVLEEEESPNRNLVQTGRNK